MRIEVPDVVDLSILPHLIPCKHCKRMDCVTVEFIADYLITQRWVVYYNQYCIQKNVVKTATNNEICCFLYSQFLYVTDWDPILRGVRNRLSNCATMMIRSEYPREGGVYVGFRNENGNENVAAVNAQEQDVDTHHWERDGMA